ncbi:unannotated protein [freshwater metagenome]|uniref:Unannotated protein n=1 Tax=freshwater metagenome TaxID=449393 RepID=A0A6J6QQ88_9ZZZZ
MRKHGLAHTTANTVVDKSLEKPFPELVRDTAPAEPGVGDGSAGLHNAIGYVDRTPVSSNLSIGVDGNLANPLPALEGSSHTIGEVEIDHRVAPPVAAVDAPGERRRVTGLESADRHRRAGERCLLVEDLDALVADHPAVGRERQTHHARIAALLDVAVGRREKAMVHQHEQPCRRSADRLSPVVQCEQQFGAVHINSEIEYIVLARNRHAGRGILGKYLNRKAGRLGGGPIRLRRRAGNSSKR